MNDSQEKPPQSDSDSRREIKNEDTEEREDILYKWGMHSEKSKNDLAMVHVH